MLTLEEKLAYISKYTMEEAQKSCEETVEAYRAALEQVYEEHKETKIRMEELEYKTEKERIVRENNKRFSNEQIKLRMALSRKQTELKDKLFEEVEERLQHFRKAPAYYDLLLKELKDALAFARGEQVILYVDPSDAEKVPQLEADTGASVTVSSYSFVGGTRAVIPGRNILIDNSFETKLAEAKEIVKIRPHGAEPEEENAEEEPAPAETI